MSSTGKEANSSRFSGTSDMPARTRASTGLRATSCPAKRIVPCPPCTPMMAFSSVVLPAPFGPITVMIWPAPTCTADVVQRADPAIAHAQPGRLQDHVIATRAGASSAGAPR